MGRFSACVTHHSVDENKRVQGPNYHHLTNTGCGAVALEHAAPGSIAVASQAANQGLSPGTATYFSFVTLATLGYRAVVPRSEVARGVAIVEAVAGQLYLAVMIARLVSLYVFDER